MPGILHKARKPNWPDEPFHRGGNGGTRDFICSMSWQGSRQRCLVLTHHSYSVAHATSIIKIAEASVHLVLIFHQCLSEQCYHRVKKIRAIWHDPELAHCLYDCKCQTGFLDVSNRLYNVKVLRLPLCFVVVQVGRTCWWVELVCVAVESV